uniref:RNA-directed RNA polymerase C-terminal domain-containing protein n=1 Tax=Riboviria sp. TaxID=2585031 RepID=A0A8K1U2V2_9VIRU|nr:MAG: hypothetical protein 1 [Riboviria sp.]
MDVDMTSSPGACSLSRFGTTNAMIFGWDGNSFDAGRLDHIRRVMFYKFLMSDSFDPMKVFVKQEPHKESKVRDGRWRLIMSVSLEDSLFDRLLFMPLYRKVLENVGATPIVIGWSPLYAGVPLLRTMLGPGPYLNIDKKAWDWSVPYWLITMIRDVIVTLSSPAPKWWLDRVAFRFEALFSKAKFQFNDGEIVIQGHPGIIKSGCYLTILVNSIAQLILLVLVSKRLSRPFPRVAILGDDTVETDDGFAEQLVQAYQDLGFVTEYSVTDNPEFCGFEYVGYDYKPSYRDKHNFLLRHLTYDDDKAASTLRSYQLLYYNEPSNLRIIRQLAVNKGLPGACVDDLTLRSLVYGF